MNLARALRPVFSRANLLFLWICLSVVYLLQDIHFIGDWREVFRQTVRIPAAIDLRAVYVLRSLVHVSIVFGLVAGLVAVFWSAGACAGGLIHGRGKLRGLFDKLPDILFGYMLIGTLHLGLGLCGLFYPYLIAAVYAVPLVAFLFRVKKTFVGVHFGPWTGVMAPGSLAFLPFVVSFMLMLRPDVFVDTLIYHMSAPELFLRLHKMVFDNVAAMFHYPLTTELLYSSAILTGVDELSHFIDFMPYAVAVTLLVIETKRTAGDMAGWLAGCLGLTLATALHDMTLSKNGLSASAFPLAGMVCLMRAGPMRSWRTAFVGALLVGCGAAVKSTGMVMIAISWPLAEIMLRENIWWNAGRRLWFAAIILVPSAPWLMKGWLSMGDPLWPLLTNILSHSVWDRESGLAIGVDRFQSNGLHLMLMFPAEFVRDWIFHQPLIIWILPFSIGGMLAMPRQWKLASIFSFLAYAVFYCLYPANASRFAIPVMLLFGTSVGVGFCSRNVRDNRRVVFLAILSSWLSAGNILASYGSYNVSAFRYILGNTTRQEYYDNVLTAYSFMGKRLAKLRLEGGVAVIGDTRTYGLPVRTIAGLWWGRHQAWLLAKTCAAPGRILVRLRQLNCRYVLGNFIADTYPKPLNIYFRWDKRMIDLWEGFVRGHLVMVEQTPFVDTSIGGYYLLKVRQVPVRQAYIRYLPGLENLHFDVSSAAAAHDNERWLQEARKLYIRFPGVGSAASQYAFCLRTLGKYREAYPLYRVLAENDVLGEDTWVGAAVCASELGKDDEAIRYAETALKVYPEWREQANMVIAKSFNNQASRLLRAGQDIKRALILAEQAVSLIPNRAAFWDTFAECQARNGLKEKALLSFRTALGKDTDKSHRATILANMGKAGFSTTGY